jgi:hypothetical protein
MTAYFIIIQHVFTIKKKELGKFCGTYGLEQKFTHGLYLNSLSAELNPILHLLALLGAHLILHISGVRVK